MYVKKKSYAICEVCCVMHDVWCSRLDFLYDQEPLSQVRQKIPYLDSFRPCEWYSKIHCMWQLYVHYILQGLISSKQQKLNLWNRLDQKYNLYAVCRHKQPSENQTKQFWHHVSMEFWKLFPTHFLGTKFKMLGTPDNFEENLNKRKLCNLL